MVAPPGQRPPYQRLVLRSLSVAQDKITSAPQEQVLIYHKVIGLFSLLAVQDYLIVNMTIAL